MSEKLKSLAPLPTIELPIASSTSFETSPGIEMPSTLPITELSVGDLPSPDKTPRFTGESGTINFDALRDGVYSAAIALNGLRKQTMEIAGQTKDASKIAITGLRSWNAQRKLEKNNNKITILRQDAQVYEQAADASLSQKDPRPAYDPLRTFNAKHMRKSSDVVAPRPPAANFNPRARNSLQEQAERRAHYRVNALNVREHRAQKYAGLYGEVLSDKRDLKDQFKNGRYTYGQKKAMKSASKIVRKANRSHARIDARLQRSAIGQDVPGRRINAKVAKKRTKSTELTNKILNLDQSEQQQIQNLKERRDQHAAQNLLEEIERANRAVRREDNRQANRAQPSAPAVELFDQDA